MISSFQGDREKRILVVTPGMFEGLNFQFCSVIVNFDLPWNPIRIEQRIGRIQRIGQEHDVLEIHSLASLGTIEEEIRDGLVRKVRIFERVLGSIGLVLGPQANWGGLHARLKLILREAKNEETLRVNLAKFFETEIEPMVAEAEAQSLGIAAWFTAPRAKRDEL